MDSIIYLVIGTLGAILGDRLDVPAGLFIGPLLAVSLAKLTPLRLGKPPKILGDLGKIILGTTIGATFTRSVLVRLGALLPFALASMFIMVGVAMFLAWVTARVTNLGSGTAFFSLTPGGLPEMISVANEIGVDVSVVAAMQFVRLTSIVIIAPALVRLFS